MISWKRDLFFSRRYQRPLLKGQCHETLEPLFFYYSNPSGLFFIDIRESNMSYLILESFFSYLKGTLSRFLKFLIRYANRKIERTFSF